MAASPVEVEAGESELLAWGKGSRARARVAQCQSGILAQAQTQMGIALQDDIAVTGSVWYSLKENHSVANGKARTIVKRTHAPATASAPEHSGASTIPNA